MTHTPADVADALLDLANVAFVDGMRVSTAIGAVLAAVLAAFAVVGLRTEPASAAEPETHVDESLPTVEAAAPAPC